MTNTNPDTPETAPDGIDDHDFTPDGLAGAPAHEEDQESLVHTGNS